MERRLDSLADTVGDVFDYAGATETFLVAHSFGSVSEIVPTVELVLTQEHSSPLVSARKRKRARGCETDTSPHSSSPMSSAQRTREE